MLCGCAWDSIRDRCPSEAEEHDGQASGRRCGVYKANSSATCFEILFDLAPNLRSQGVLNPASLQKAQQQSGVHKSVVIVASVGGARQSGSGLLFDSIEHSLVRQVCRAIG